ncbi:hypothetical protein K438DRAFT_1955842 [Mycena galopus ATCC 62051]|nr:hypothetical protein K438DRAFT_1955842 [Mycena galopus ATCC 62051]
MSDDFEYSTRWTSMERASIIDEGGLEAGNPFISLALLKNFLASDSANAARHLKRAVQQYINGGPKKILVTYVVNSQRFGDRQWYYVKGQNDGRKTNCFATSRITTSTYSPISDLTRVAFPSQHWHSAPSSLSQREEEDLDPSLCISFVIGARR